MRRAILAAALVLAFSLPARSYVYETWGGSPVRWPNAMATVYHDPATIQGAYVTELKAALAVWSNVSGSAFRFTHGGSSPSANVKDSNNGITDVYIDPTLPPFGYAVTMVNTPYTSADITERDIAFNGNVTWTTSATNQAGGPVDFRTVAIHELGHVLGLLHESSKTSVMNVSGWDPAFARHSLEVDDMDGVRFLYPGTGPGPGPGPVPTGADLTVDSVEASPEDAGPGDMVTVGYRLRNAGVTDAGSFKVSAYLTGGLVPKRTDPWLGSVAEAGLDVGASRTGGILADVPTGLLPGHYRFGVLVDSDNEVSERNEANNGGATDPLLEITRPPLTIGPGHLVQADLGPLGTDRFTLTLRAGMLIKLRASQDPGSLRLAMGPEGSEAALLDTGLKKVAKGKVDIPEDGPYVIRLTSESASFSRYELLVRTKKMKTKSIEEVAGEIRIPFRVYRGSRVKAIVTGRKGFHPEAEIEGLEVPMKTTKKKVKLGAFDAEANGELTLVVRPADGEPGSAKCIIRILPPKKEIVVSR